MRVVFRRVRNHFFSAFRELFVYHHTSLEFRAKTYALMIAGAEEPVHHYLETLETIAREIYAETDRAGALVMTVKEYVDSAYAKKKGHEQMLLNEIIQELRLMPRYALKIEPAHLRKLQECTQGSDSKIYQERIIDFLSQKRLEHETIRY